MTFFAVHIEDCENWWSTSSHTSCRSAVRAFEPTLG